jgi:diadenosine tetraphosphate (Ap4A) HIT family hydrolase
MIKYKKSDMVNQSVCPFCNLDKSRIVLANAHAIAIYDGYPVSPGHSLIVPKRHIASFFEVSKEEQTAMLDLLAEMRERVLAEHSAEGFTSASTTALPPAKRSCTCIST